MLNGEWRLVYPGVDYVFGTGATEVFNLTAPDLGDVEIRSSDYDRPRTDGVSFGADYRGGRTITFDLGARAATETDVRAAIASLSRAWRADSIRTTPGAVAELHSRYRDEERVVFGRPRRFAPFLKEAKTGLFGVATASFDAIDDRFYSPAYQTATVSIVPAPGGGLEAPLASPLSTTTSSDRSTGFTVDSELPVWPVVEIQGPITDPTVEIVGLWKIELRTTIAADQTVTIDAQPWARSITRDGASVAGAATRSSVRLAKAEIPSGDYEFVLRGTDSTGTASASLRWRNVYTTP